MSHTECLDLLDTHEPTVPTSFCGEQLVHHVHAVLQMGTGSEH